MTTAALIAIALPVVVGIWGKTSGPRPRELPPLNLADPLILEAAREVDAMGLTGDRLAPLPVPKPPDHTKAISSYALPGWRYDGQHDEYVHADGRRITFKYVLLWGWPP